MGKSSRKARRQARRAKRQERRVQLERLIGAVKSANISFEPQDDGTNPPLVDVFKQIWPILDPALKFAINLKLTKDRADKVLTSIHKAAQAVVEGGSEATENDFVEKFQDAWDYIEPKLELVQLVTPNNVDKVLDDVIEIGDWIAGE